MLSTLQFSHSINDKKQLAKESRDAVENKVFRNSVTLEIERGTNL